MTTQEIWGLEALPADISVWWEDRIATQQINDDAPDATVQRTLEERRVKMIARVRLQAARALAGEMTSIAAFMINDILQLPHPVDPAQFPTGVGSYVNYPLAPPVPVQIHVVSKLPDGGRGALSANIDYLGLIQARLILDWFERQAAANPDFYKGTGIHAVRTTVWVANSRRLIEMDPVSQTAIDSEGWIDANGYPYRLTNGYRIPPLGSPAAG